MYRMGIITLPCSTPLQSITDIFFNYITAKTAKRYFFLNAEILIFQPWHHPTRLWTSALPEAIRRNQSGKVALGNALSSAFWKLSKTSPQSCSPLHFSSAPWICSLPAADAPCMKLRICEKSKTSCCVSALHESTRPSVLIFFGCISVNIFHFRRTFLGGLNKLSTNCNYYNYYLLKSKMNTL